MSFKERPPVYYSDYLQLDKILNAQQPESTKEGIIADDELLFIIIHQVYELWFKEVLHEVNLVRDVFRQPNISNNSADIYTSLHRLQRVAKILQLLVQHMDIIETMTPLDFLDFRDLLRPASGFQSIQFKILEASLGLKYEDRYGQEYYLSQLNEEDRNRVREAEAQTTLISLVDKWLERMPYAEESRYWEDDAWQGTDFWQTYREAYKNSLGANEQNNMITFDALFMNEAEYDSKRALSIRANRSALFIMLYRDYPLLHMPFELLSAFTDIDNLLGAWRHRHIQMVQKTIGKRVGTGGSTGAGYLKAAADSHHIFKELADFTSFLLPRNDLPILPKALVKSLHFTEE